MAITQITAASLADNAVTSAKIAANQIGSSERDLTANYAFTVTVTGTTQGLKLLATATASNSATLDFSSTYITSTYDSYMLLGEQLIPATDVTEPWLKFSHDNGSNLHGSGIESGRLYIAVSQSGNGHEYNANQAYMQLATDLGNDAGKGFVFRCDLINLTTTTRMNCVFHTCGEHGSQRINWLGGGCNTDTNAINYVRFQMSSGNITSGRVRLYGITKV